MVPLGSAQICRVLDAINDKVSRAQDCKLHILGFAKADQLHDFKKYSIYSFDTTSPLLRAFKDNVRNYYQLQSEGGLDYFTAIRIPSTTSPSVQRRLIKPGKEKLEDLVAMEGRALMNVRKYAEGQASIDEAVDAVIDYSRKTTWSEKVSEATNENRLEKLAVQYRRTLVEKAWLGCSCAVCRKAGIEVMIFRGSNRNKRRGIHNLSVYHQHLQAVMAA